MGQLSKEYLAKIYSSVLYSGVRNESGTAVADIADGWGTIIAAEDHCNKPYPSSYWCINYF